MQFCSFPFPDESSIWDWVFCLCSRLKKVVPSLYPSSSGSLLLFNPLHKSVLLNSIKALPINVPVVGRFTWKPNLTRQTIKPIYRGFVVHYFVFYIFFLQCFNPYYFWNTIGGCNVICIVLKLTSNYLKNLYLQADKLRIRILLHLKGKCQIQYRLPNFLTDIPAELVYPLVVA